MTTTSHRVEVSTTTAPTGERLQVTRNLDTAEQTTIDMSTGRPWTPPSRRKPVDNGVADGPKIDRRFTTGDGWVARSPVTW